MPCDCVRDDNFHFRQLALAMKIEPQLFRTKCIFAFGVKLNLKTCTADHMVLPVRPNHVTLMIVCQETS